MATKTQLKNFKGSTQVYDATNTEALTTEVSKHYEATIAFGATTTDTDAIATALGENIPVIGNTAVVKRAITDETTDTPYSYTAYVYNGTSWVAMDGNYNVDNVIFGDNMTITKAWGKYTIPTSGASAGRNTIPSKGLSLKEFFKEVLSEETISTVTYPKLTFSSSNAGKYEVGTTLDLVCKISGSAGTYNQYNSPATGVVWKTYTVSVSGTPGKIADGNVQTIAGLFKNADGTASQPVAGNFSSNAATIDFVTTANLVVCEDTSLKFTATGTHDAATTYANTNLGEASSLKILANDTKSTRTVSTGNITGVRKWFYGYKKSSSKINISTLTSDQVRGLTMSESIPTSLTTTDMQQIIIAIPSSKGKTVTSIKNSKNDAPQTVKHKTVSVAGANGFAPVEYDIYYVDNENSDGASTTITYSIEVK